MTPDTLGGLDQAEPKEILAPGKKILVLGGDGMIGSRFVEMFGGANFLAPGVSELDITDRAVVRDYIEKNKPDFIINFAAYTNVGEAEKQKDNLAGDCWQVNVEGPRNILQTLKELGLTEETHYIQISTDMVFPGNEFHKGPYRETDSPPDNFRWLTWYGATKLVAERLTSLYMGERTTVLRTIYPVGSGYEGKDNYLSAPGKQYKENGKLKYPLFTDQQISIADVDQICIMLGKIVEGKLYGVFHCASKDLTNPFQVISYYLKRVFGGSSNVRRGEMGDYAKRYPQFGGLTCEDTFQRLGVPGMGWRKIVNKAANQDKDLLLN